MLKEATKHQMTKNGVDSTKFGKTTLILIDKWGAIHIIQVDHKKVRFNKHPLYGEMDDKKEFSKMGRYFGDRGKVKMVDVDIAKTFNENHGDKLISIQSSLAITIANTIEHSHKAFRLYKTFKKQGFTPSVYIPFMFRAYELIKDGK